MKFTDKSHPSLASLAGYCGALLGFVALTLAGTSLQAATDISASQNGAFVVFSSPLSKGILPETLLNGKLHQTPFAPKTSPQLLAIDLGNTYKLTNLRNLPPNSKVYILGKKPKGKETWESLLDAGAPQATDGAVGQYLVIVFEKDPLEFSDPLVDGDLLATNNGSILGSGFGIGNSIPIAITPLTSTEIISH